MLSVEQAQEQLLASARPLAQTEQIAADAALDRILSTPLVAALNVPPLDNSAMDGYAVRAAEAVVGAILPISQRIPAGQIGQPLAPGSVARIFTGAPTPDGADTVVMQEDTEPAEGGVRFLKTPKPGASIRRTGLAELLA